MLGEKTVPAMSAANCAKPFETSVAYHKPAPDLYGGGLGPRRDGRPHVRLQYVKVGDDRRSH